MKNRGFESFPGILRLVKKAKAAGKIIVTTNGCFDIIHVGHIKYLEKAKSLGDILVVGINSDFSVRLNKGNTRPIVPEKERAEIIASLKAVDYVFIFNQKTPHSWLEKIRPHIHAKGSEYAPNQIPERAVVEKYKGRVVRVPQIKCKSTTNLIQKVISINKKRATK